MDKEQPSLWIQTVKGPIRPDQLGATLMHEHCLVSQPGTYRKVETDDPEYAEFLRSKVSVENRSRIFFHMHKHHDNLDISDEALTIRELGWFREAGGQALVDVTVPGIGRNPEALLRISEAVGIHIVASTGLYIEDSHPAAFRAMDKHQIARFCIDEIQHGMDGTGIRPGYIGEIGISDDYTPREEEALRGAAIASRETGYGVTVHQPIFQTWGGRILDAMEDEGVDLDRVVLSHCDPTLEVEGYHLSLLERGARIQFDQFGLEFPCTYGPYRKRWLPRDIERIRAIKRLMDAGFEKRITLSMDLCFKSLYRSFGGAGYAHLLDGLYDCFLHEGITEAQMDRLLRKNPAAILSAPRTRPRE